MTKIYKTARGKGVDIDKIKLANETSIAVGNMKVNARGDILSPGNRVATSRNQLMDQVYAVSAGDNGGGYSPNDPASYMENQAIMEAGNAQKLNDLVNNLTVPVTPNQDTATTPVPAARGSLANSVAKPATVTQEPMPKPGKTNGPSRI